MNVSVHTRERVRACGDRKKMRERSGNESAASQSEHDLRSRSDLGSWPLSVRERVRGRSAWKRLAESSTMTRMTEEMTTTTRRDSLRSPRSRRDRSALLMSCTA